MELSNAVSIKGFEVGSIYAIRATDKSINGILVTISMKKDVDIPKNSVAVINTGIINSATIVIEKGDATDFVSDGDTLVTIEKGGIIIRCSAQSESGNEKS